MTLTLLMLRTAAQPGTYTALTPVETCAADLLAASHGALLETLAAGRSSFAFDDYAGQADEYLGKAVPRRNGVKQIGAGALPSQVNFNDGSSTPR